MTATTDSARRVPLTLAAQSLSSLTNFVTSAAALAADDLESFGQFSTAFQLCVVVIAVGQGSTGAALLVHAPGKANHEVEQLRRATASAALVLGSACSLVLAAAGLVVGGGLGTLLLLSALGAPSLVSQYTLREYRYARQNQLGVVVADVIWLGVVLAVVGADWLTAWDATPTHYLASWLAGATLSAAPLWIGGISFRRSSLGIFWQTTGVQAVRLGVESLLARSALSVVFVLTGVFAGEAATGSMAATILLFSPLSVVNSSASALVVPREIRRRGIHVVRHSVPLAVSATMMVVTVGWGLCVYVFDRSPLAFQPFRLEPNGISNSLFAATMVHYVALAAWRGPAVGLRIADATKEGLAARVRTSLMQYVFPAIGLAAGGITMGALGLGVATTCGVLIAWHRFAGLESR